jgi:quercetin dioxygenase-like cupin family protein
MRLRALTAKMVAFLLLVGISSPLAAQQPGTPAITRRTVLQTTTTVTGQPLQFPLFRNVVIATVVELAPGGQTGPQRFFVPTVLYVLEGTLIAEVEGSPARTIAGGQAIVPATNISVNGRNLGVNSLRWLAVSFADASQPAVSPPTAQPIGLRVTSVLRTTKTRTGEDIHFPLLANQLSTSSTESPPGAVTERHIHPHTQFIYVTDGIFTIEAEGPTTASFRAGQALVETTRPHFGGNRGATTQKYVGVFAGELGVPFVVPRP